MLAYGTQIENARGGFGNDVIIGNEVRNLLFGNFGNDILEGGTGNDVLRGGENNDIYNWRLGDGRDAIREEQKGGVDTIHVIDSSALDSLQDDFVFRKFGRDLRIDLRFDQGEAQGSITIKDMQWGGSQVETLRMFSNNGNQVGLDVDLTSIFQTASTESQRFRLTTQESAYGFIAVPV
jgi:Ca2+-binding RTX toxin-like protein